VPVRHLIVRALKPGRAVLGGCARGRRRRDSRTEREMISVTLWTGWAVLDAAGSINVSRRARRDCRAIEPHCTGPALRFIRPREIRGRLGDGLPGAGWVLPLDATHKTSRDGSKQAPKARLTPGAWGKLARFRPSGNRLILDSYSTRNLCSEMRSNLTRPSVVAVFCVCTDRYTGLRYRSNGP